jgi:hypothetical protein
VEKAPVGAVVQRLACHHDRGMLGQTGDVDAEGRARVMESATAVASARFAFEACCFLTGRAPVHVGTEWHTEVATVGEAPACPHGGAVAWATLRKCRLKASS